MSLLGGLAGGAAKLAIERDHHDLRLTPVADHRARRFRTTRRPRLMSANRPPTATANRIALLEALRDRSAYREPTPPAVAA